METWTCMCQAQVTADDRESLVVPVELHFDAAHAELEVTETSVRNYLEAEVLQTGPTERLDEIGDVTIRPITPESLDDFLALFDHDAFSTAPEWAACYCLFHHLGGAEIDLVDWSNRTWQKNRAEITGRIDTGTTTGLLAYVGDKPVAWCNASSRASMPAHAGRDDIPDIDVGSIVCFVVAPPYRHHGVMERMLTTACEQLAADGFRYAEGYPPEELRGPNSAYRGTVSLFENAGFEKEAEGPVYRKGLT